MSSRACARTVIELPEAWLVPERFDYATVGERWAVLRLLARLGSERGAPAGAKLLIERSPWSATFPARACATERRVAQSGGGSGLLWRASFALPLELVRAEEMVFSLVALDRGPLSLPVPEARSQAREALILSRSPYRGRPTRRLSAPDVRQRVAALATAVAVTTASTPAVGLAAGTASPSALTARARGEQSKPGSTDAQAKAAVKAHLAARSAAPTTSDSGTKAAPVQLSVTPAVGPDGQACLPADHQATLANPTGQSTAGAGQLPLCPPAPAPPAHPKPAPAHHGHAAAHTGAGAPKSPAPAPVAAKAPAATAPAQTTPTPTTPAPSAPAVPSPPAPPNSGGVAVGDPGTATTPTTPAPVRPPAATNVPTPPAPPAAPPVPPTPPGAPGLSSLGPAPSSLQPPAPARAQAEPRSSARPTPRPAAKSPEPASRGSVSHTPTGGAPVQLSGLSSRPPHALSSTTAPGLLAPRFTGPGSWVGSVDTNPELTGALSNLSALLVNGNRPPAFLIPIYMEAGRRYHVPWPVLAGINAIETDYGRNLHTSSAGAIGWMQFMPATWKEWGVAADGHKVANPYDPRDAIFSAARYLAASGASRDVAGAVFSYNHAGWYVTEVLQRARAIAAGVHYSHFHIRHHVISLRIESKQFKHGWATFRGGYLTHYDRLIASANMVSAADFPYLFGGGHEQPARFGPFDCSGAVSYIVQQAGYKVPTAVSGDISSWKFPAGPGAVTIFYNPIHTFMRIGNRYFGTSGFARPGGGAGWFDTDRLPASYLATFHEVHVPQLHGDSFARLVKLLRKRGIPG